jgi:hypothetical protein
VSSSIDSPRATSGRRERPLLLRRGTLELVLPADDTNLLLDAVDRLVDGMQKSRWDEDLPGIAVALNAHVDRLHDLQDVLLGSSSSLTDPPLKLDRRLSRLLRDVLADMRGYQRTDLTAGLLELRRMVTDH